jgi:hypothetical protein
MPPLPKRKTAGVFRTGGGSRALLRFSTHIHTSGLVPVFVETTTVQANPLLQQSSPANHARPAHVFRLVRGYRHFYFLSGVTIHKLQANKNRRSVSPKAGFAKFISKS